MVQVFITMLHSNMGILVLFMSLWIFFSAQQWLYFPISLHGYLCFYYLRGRSVPSSAGSYPSCQQWLAGSGQIGAEIWKQSRLPRWWYSTITQIITCCLSQAPEPSFKTTYFAMGHGRVKHKHVLHWCFLFLLNALRCKFNFAGQTISVTILCLIWNVVESSCLFLGGGWGLWSGFLLCTMRWVRAAASVLALVALPVLRKDPAKYPVL